MNTRWARVLSYELRPYPLNLRLALALLLLKPLPSGRGERLRAAALRWAGVHIGRSTMFAGTPKLHGPGDIRQRLRIGAYCWINTGLHLDLDGDITIGDHVTIGYEAAIITSTHAIGGPEHRAGPHGALPVRVGNGVWLGARCTILPGVCIGDGTVVGAGAVVTRNAPPNTLVGGVPARVLRELPEAGERQRQQGELAQVV